MSEVIELQVSDEFHGKRLDAVLGALVENHSRSALGKSLPQCLKEHDRRGPHLG